MFKYEMVPTTHLATLNSHKRDKRIVFDEKPHIYYIDGSSDGYISCTTWNHTHFEQFDANVIIDKMMKSSKWKSNKYYGKSKEEIKAMWDKNRDESALAGTQLHYDIECYYNECPNENDSIEYHYFKQFLKDYGDLKPYRTEWMIFNEDIKISGSIDMVFEKPDGHLSIYDWKRCKEISKTNGFNKWGNKECIEHLPDTNFWHYSLQLNTYKNILEEKYGKIVDELYLVCLHPDNKNNDYQRIKVPNLQEEIQDLFKLRKQEIGRI
jgi:hypothetical protein